MRLILLFLLFTPSLVFAKKLYKYQDDNGVWQFTDHAPVNANNVTVKQLAVSPQQRVKLIKNTDNQRVSYSIYNGFGSAIEVWFNFPTLINVSVSTTAKSFIVNAGQSPVLFSITSINTRNTWQYNVDYQYSLGIPLPHYDTVINYLPPIPPNTAYFITQAFNGSSTHNQQHNRYAVDIAMPEGTPIHAARSGIVVTVDNDFIEGGVSDKLLNKANQIIVLHEDGSMAVYAHLAPESAQVQQGMRINAGQLLSYSGNTGYSSGAHLHFVVWVNKGHGVVSVPFNFIIKNETFTPIENSLLKN